MNFFEKRRIELGLSQREMAMRLRVANTTVAAWESDENIPRPTIAALAAAYEATERAIETELTLMRRRIESKSPSTH